VTCDEIFLCADIALEDLPSCDDYYIDETRYFDKDGLRMSTESDCHWCAVLLHYYNTAYSKIEEPECTSEETTWGVKLGWQLRQDDDDELLYFWKLREYEPFLRLGSQQVATFKVSVSPVTGKPQSLSRITK
jgi:hypothetical protein